MKSGFAHFDGSHRENFLAAVLLMIMENDDAAREIVAGHVRRELGIDAACPVTGLSREVRLAATRDGNYSRADLCLDFGASTAPFCAFIEIKTHENWDEDCVIRQVTTQANGTPARIRRDVRGSVLLAPTRLCQRTAVGDARVHTIPWRQLLDELRALHSTSLLTTLAITHLEENVDHTAGLDRTLTPHDFEQATTTIACLRQFLVDCITDIGAGVRGEQLYLTPGDGKPRRGSGWAWHGLSVPISFGGRRGHLGIYKFAEAPPGERRALDTLWLEAYLGDGVMPVAFVKFAPPTLGKNELDAVRAALKEEWRIRVPVPSGEATRPEATLPELGTRA